MNKERAKELAPILEAFSQGKKVQRFNKGWVTYSKDIIPDGHLDLPGEWRIKPEPNEFWIVVDESTGGVKYALTRDEFESEQWSYLKTIKVREVLDDE